MSVCVNPRVSVSIMWINRCILVLLLSDLILFSELSWILIYMSVILIYMSVWSSPVYYCNIFLMVHYSILISYWPIPYIMYISFIWPLGVLGMSYGYTFVSVLPYILSNGLKPLTTCMCNWPIKKKQTNKQRKIKQ